MKTTMTTFDNHPPVNFSNAEKVASASHDGGAYDGIGYNTFKVYQGTKFHLVHFYSDGCERNNKTSSTSEHLGTFDTKEALIAHLVQEPGWPNNVLLDDLGYEGVPA